MRIRLRSLHSLLVAAILWVTPAVRASTLYVSDHPTGGGIDTVRTFNGSTGASLNPNFVPLLGATGIALGPDGNLYVATTGDFSMGAGVLRYDANTGTPLGVFVNYEGAPPTPDPHDVNGPQGMTFGPGGRLYITDVTVSNLHLYEGPAAAIPGASVGALSGNLVQPVSVAANAAGDLYVAGTAGGGVDIWNYNGISHTFAEAASPIGVGNLTNPIDLTFAPNGDLYVVDGQNFVKRFDAAGNFLSTVLDFSHDTFQPAGIAFGPDGNLYVSGVDFSAASPGQVREYAPDGSNGSLFISDGLEYPTYLRFGPSASGDATGVPLPSSALMGTALIPALALHRIRRQRR